MSTPAILRTPGGGGGGSGAVVAVRTVNKTDPQAAASTTWVDVTGLSITYSPSTASNEILVLATIQGSGQPGVGAGMYRIVRDGNPILVGDAAGSRIRVGAVAYDLDASIMIPISISGKDTPATSSAVTYKVQMQTNGSGSAYVNRSHTDTDAANFGRGASSLTIMEVTP